MPRSYELTTERQKGREASTRKMLEDIRKQAEINDIRTLESLGYAKEFISR